MSTDERTPINLYTIDFGYIDKGMTKEEIIKDLKNNMQKWFFILAANIVFTAIIVYMNVKVTNMTPVCMFLYIAALAMTIVSIIKMHKYHSRYRNIKNETNI